MNEHNEWTTYQAGCLERLSSNFKKVADELIEYSGGLDDSSTEVFAKDIIGNAGLLDYLATCLRNYEKKENNNAEQKIKQKKRQKRKATKKMRINHDNSNQKTTSNM